jgi:hypothetical protein
MAGDGGQHGLDYRLHCRVQGVDVRRDQTALAAAAQPNVRIRALLHIGLDASLKVFRAALCAGRPAIDITVFIDKR